jgi:FMN-dependent NADH-azoreductase
VLTRVANCHSDLGPADIGIANGDRLRLWVPMYNFSVPAGFKASIDQIVIPGRTYTYTADGSGSRTGLLKGKKATVIMSRGWLYRDGSPLAACNLQEPWIRMIFGFIGVTDIDFVVAEGIAQLDRGNGEREEYLKPIREQVRRSAGLGSKG